MSSRISSAKSPEERSPKISDYEPQMKAAPAHNYANKVGYVPRKTLKSQPKYLLLVDSHSKTTQLHHPKDQRSLDQHNQ